MGSKVGDAWAPERRYLHALPDPLPDVDLRTEVRVQTDGFVRVGSVDYSVPPGLGGRRVQVRMSPREIVVHLEGSEIARHRRSYAPADVVLDPRQIASLPEAMELLVDYYRRLAGEHPNWDEYRERMQEEQRCLIRIHIEGATG